MRFNEVLFRGFGWSEVQPSETVKSLLYSSLRSKDRAKVQRFLPKAKIGEELSALKLKLGRRGYFKELFSFSNPFLSKYILTSYLSSLQSNAIFFLGFTQK